MRVTTPERLVAYSPLFPTPRKTGGPPRSARISPAAGRGAFPNMGWRRHTHARQVKAVEEKLTAQPLIRPTTTVWADRDQDGVVS